MCLGVKVARGHDDGLFWACNLSDAGMMLAAQAEFRVGERLAIELSRELVVDGVLEWTGAGRCGIRFAQPIDSLAFLQSLADLRREDRRRARRLPVRRLATCYSERGVRAVTVTDVSARGVGLAHGGGLAPGSCVKLVLERGLARSGRICWSDDTHAGVFLEQPFARTELESARNF